MGSMEIVEHSQLDEFDLDSHLTRFADHLDNELGEEVLVVRSVNRLLDLSSSPCILELSNE